MKLKIQLAAFAALAVLAGCGECSGMGAQKQSAAPVIANEAKFAASAAAPATPTPAAPAPAAAPTHTNSAASSN